MFHLKHDVQIHLKNEKEIFQLIRLLLFTFLFSAVFLGLPDYIWNITWYKISTILVMWIVAIPSIINCFERKNGLRELLGNHVLSQIIMGIVLGTAMGIVVALIHSKTQPGVVIVKSSKVEDVLFRFVFYIFAVGPTEELIYRVAIIGSLERLLKNKWIVYILADLLFAGAHLFQGNWPNAVFNLFAGALYIALYKWKKGGYVFATVTHGIYDFMVVYLPLFYFLCTLK